MSSFAVEIFHFSEDLLASNVYTRNFVLTIEILSKFDLYIKTLYTIFGGKSPLKKMLQ